MAKVNLQIKTTDVNDKNQTTTISYANPNASDQVLKTFAQKIVALSTDMYRETNKIETTNLDTESSKTIATIGLATSSATVAELKAQFANNGNKNYAFTYNGDGTVYCYLTNTQNNNALLAKIYSSNNVLSLQSKATTFDGENADIPAQEIVLFAPETANYKAAQATFTVTD